MRGSGLRGIGSAPNTVRVLAVAVSFATAVAALAFTPAGAQQPATEVAVAPFADVAVHPQREAPASVVALNESRLSAEITAPVVEIGADVGQAVNRGHVLARLDDTDYRLALDRAVAQREAAASRLELAERQLERSRELRQNNFVSPEALNQRETEVASLKADVRVLDAQVATARRQLDKAVIRAPYDAAVRARAAQLGELAAPGAPLFVLTQLGASEISARVPADAAPQLPKMREPVFEAGATRVPVRLLRLSPVTDPATRTREARLGFAAGTGGNAAAPGSRGDAAAGLPPPGTEGRLLWNDPRPHLPPELVVRRNGSLGVFVESATGVQFVAAPDAQEGRPAIVALPADARVVVRGQQALRDGAAVRIVQR